jgi:hypothetical protein
LFLLKKSENLHFIVTVDSTGYQIIFHVLPYFFLIEETWPYHCPQMIIFYFFLCLLHNHIYSTLANIKTKITSFVFLWCTAHIWEYPLENTIWIKTSKIAWKILKLQKKNLQNLYFLIFQSVLSQTLKYFELLKVLQI